MQCANTYCYSTLHPHPSLNKTRTGRNSIQSRRNFPDAQAFELPSNVKSITSTSNPFIKHCLKLRQSSSYRHSHGSTLIVGSTPISKSGNATNILQPISFKFHESKGESYDAQAREIYNFHVLKEARPTTMDCLFLLDGAEVPEELDHVPTRIVRVSSVVMKKLSGVRSTESTEAIALMRFPPSFLNLNETQIEADSQGWFPCPHRILVLEGIQDPGNLGTLLRSAMAFGWDGVFLLPGCCDPFNDKALRASRGSSFQLPIVSGNWIHLHDFRNEFQVKMLAGHPHISNPSKPVFRLSQGLADSLAGTPLCLLLGSEGGGLSEKSWQECELVSIPMAENFESLNVSVAGGIFLYMLQSREQKFV